MNIYCTVLFGLVSLGTPIESSKQANEEATVLIGFSLKNREAYLPYFLSFFHRLSFPKKQIHLLIILGKNIDRTPAILHVWLESFSTEYKTIDIVKEKADWDIRQQREDILNRARAIKTDYVMFLDSFTFIVEQNTIQHLMSKKKVIVAGMLRSPKLYSNFWGEMTEYYDYKRSFLYKTIYERKNRGCFKVPMVISCILIDLRVENTQHLSFLGPNDNEIQLAISAQTNDISIFVCNDKHFGFIMSSTSNSDDYNIEEEIKNMNEIKNMIHEEFYLLDALEIFITSGFVKYPAIDNLEMNKIYVINLLKRSRKKQIMQERLKNVGLEAQFFEGVDGTKLNSTYLMSIGANQLKEYDDIYMTVGAIGIFLSHYFIWKDVIKNKYERVIVFEDDTELDSKFREIVRGALKELDDKGLEWELLFLNRGTAMGPLGDKVKHSNYLREVGYGVLSISAYVLNLKGAKKLATSQVLSSLIPVDEYVLMMHSSQYRELRGWETNYGPPNLKVYLVEPEPSFNIPFYNDSFRVTDTLYSPRTNDETFGVPIGHKVPYKKTEL